VQQSFTTEPKHPRKTTVNISRKGSIVKERCRQLSEIALELCPDRRISHEDLAYLVKRYVGADRETLRAYLGYHGLIRRRKNAGEGYVSGLPKKGYLEIFGFMKPVSHGEWIINAQVTLPSFENCQLPSQCNEMLSVSKEKISLAVDRVDCETVENRLRGCDSVETEENTTPRVGEINSNMPGEREILLHRFSRDFSAAPEELSILTSRPYGLSLGRAKIDWVGL